MVFHTERTSGDWRFSLGVFWFCISICDIRNAGFPYKEIRQGPGDSPGIFCARERYLPKELSIFVDESGDLGGKSKHYLFTPVSAT